MNPQLAQTARDVLEQKEGRQASVRTLLSWFGAKRRGVWIAQQIRDDLKAAGLRTDPDFEITYIDSDVRFLPLVAPAAKTEQTRTTGEIAQPVVADLGVDPVPRIGLLASANRPPVSIAPDATLEKAATVMMMHDYSQLPVMQNERTVKGMVSWKTIGHATAVGRTPKLVREAMDPDVVVVLLDALLFETVATIISREVVLVKSSDNKICGIVTGNDINSQFLELSEAFLRLGEIENQIRRLIRGKFDAAELKAACDPEDTTRVISDVSDLTFGEYVRLVENPASWTKLKLPLDRPTFAARLNDVRRIRNDVMHFHPDGIDEDDHEILRRTAYFLQQL